MSEAKNAGMLIEELFENRNTIQRLERYNDEIEKEIVKMWAKGLEEKPRRTHFKVRPYRPEWLTGFRKEPAEPSIRIEYVDSREDDVYDGVMVSIERLNSGKLNTDDYITDQDIENSYRKKQEAKEERRRYEELKAKYEGVES